MKAAVPPDHASTRPLTHREAEAEALVQLRMRPGLETHHLGDRLRAQDADTVELAFAQQHQRDAGKVRGGGDESAGRSDRRRVGVVGAIRAAPERVTIGRGEGAFELPWRFKRRAAHTERLEKRAAGVLGKGLTRGLGRHVAREGEAVVGIDDALTRWVEGALASRQVLLHRRNRIPPIDDAVPRHGQSGAVRQQLTESRGGGLTGAVAHPEGGLQVSVHGFVEVQPSFLDLPHDEHGGQDLRDGSRGELRIEGRGPAGLLIGDARRRARPGSDRREPPQRTSPACRRALAPRRRCAERHLPASRRPRLPRPASLPRPPKSSTAPLSVLTQWTRSGTGSGSSDRPRRIDLP